MKYYDTLAERCEYEYWVDRAGRKHKYKPEPDETEPHEICSLHSRIASRLRPGTRAQDILKKEGWIAVGVLGGLHSPTCEKLPTCQQLGTLADAGYTMLRKGYGATTYGLGEVWIFHRG